MWPSFFCFHWRAVDAYLQGRWNIICHVKQDDYWPTLFQVTLTQGAKTSWILACPLDKHLLYFACLEPLHPLLEDDLPGPYPIPQLCVKSYLPSIKSACPWLQDETFLEPCQPQSVNSCVSELDTLETIRELEPKCILQLLQGSLLSMSRSAIG